MKTHEIAAHLGIATSTIRTWSNGEFKQYLSPTGQGGEGQYRNFTETDSRILAYVNVMKQQSRPRDEIHMALKRMQGEDWIDLPPMPPAPPGVSPLRMVPESTAETALVTQRSALLREIAIKDERIEQLESEVADLRKQLEANDADHETLLIRAIEAETELKLWRSGRIKPE